MALIKKTIVLSNTKTIGYASVIQVGSETGIKVVGEELTEGMQAVVRIGKERYYFLLTGKRTEIFVSAQMAGEEEVGCLLAKEGTLFARGGATVSIEELSHFTASPVPPKAEETADLSEERTENTETNEEAEEDKEILGRLAKERENYYFTVKDKVDELFIVHPEEPLLATLIPDSEWVKVRYDGEDYYVVGRLYDDQKKVKYLGYGVPGTESVKPPKVADGIASFLPEKEGCLRGYWLFFQNASNGKIE